MSALALKGRSSRAPFGHDGRVVITLVALKPPRIQSLQNSAADPRRQREIIGAEAE